MAAAPPGESQIWGISYILVYIDLAMRPGVLSGYVQYWRGLGGKPPGVVASG
jgi:hypothetical protein